MMKNLAATLATLISGLASVTDKAEATGPTEQSDSVTDAVSLRPLNFAGDNMFAAHRSHSSHSSHRSHRSHRSGTGGGYRSPAPSQPQQQQGAAVPGSGLAAPGTTQRATPAAPAPSTPRAPVFSHAEKLKLQVMRTQIALTSLGLYKGPINGELDSDTKESLRHFQAVKGFEANGLMSTDTLNALGVPAVQ